MLNWFKKKKKNTEEIIEIDDIENVEEELDEELEEIVEDQFVEEPFVEEEAVAEFEEELFDLQDEILIDLEQKEQIEEFIEEPVEELIEDRIEDIKVTKISIFDKLKSGLTKTRKDMSDKIESVLSSYKKVDEELFDDLEEVLVTADVGVNTTMKIIDRLKVRIKLERVTDPAAVKELLKDEIKKLMKESVKDNSLIIEPLPAVILVVGVNGAGKTTTIGKLSYSFKKEGKKVLIAAGDTFRAAAIEQLEEWSKRSKVEFIAHTEGADPAAVIFDGIQAAKARKSDILICDTAGRLHNKSNLMNELNKIFRVVDREYGDATKEILLVLDATTGQNAINQAKVFKEVANITGVVLTKLDGTAKGGVIIAIQAELGLPIKLVGVGEGLEDLQPFNVEDFVEAIFN